MTSHVAECPGAEVEPLAPFLGVVVAGQVRTLLGHAEPKIPVQLLGYRVGSIGTRMFVSPMLAAPTVDFLHLADRRRLDRRHDLAVNLVRVDLDPHLRDRLLLARRARTRRAL